MCLGDCFNSMLINTMFKYSKRRDKYFLYILQKVNNSTNLK